MPITSKVSIEAKIRDIKELEKKVEVSLAEKLAELVKTNFEIGYFTLDLSYKPELELTER